MSRKKAKKMHSCPECSQRFAQTNHLKSHLEKMHQRNRNRDVARRKANIMTSAKKNKPQQERRTEITGERLELMQLMVKIEPLRMEFTQPEKDKLKQQEEKSQVKTEPPSDTEEEQQQNVNSYHLRGSSKQTPVRKTEATSPEKSRPKELRQRKSPARPNKESALTNTENLQQRKFSARIDKEPVLTNTKESQPGKLSASSNKEPVLTITKESQPRKLSASSNKEPVLTNTKESRPRKLSASSNKESVLTNTKESRPRKSPASCNKESALTNTKKLQQGKLPACSSKETRKTLEAVPEGKVFSCSECGLRFNENARLEKHLKWHEQLIMNSVSYACNKCGMIYKQLSRLKSHIASVHVVMGISQHGSKSRNRSGQSCGGNSGQVDDETGRKTGEENGQQRNEEEGQHPEESDDEVDDYRDEENDQNYEEGDQGIIEEQDQMCWEDGTTVDTLVDSQKTNKEHCKRVKAGDGQDVRESQGQSVVITVTSSTAQTHLQATEEHRELDSDLQQMRRSPRMSSSTYVHLILRREDSQQRRDGTNCQESRQANVQDGRQKRPNEGEDTEMKVRKRLRTSESVSGGVNQPEVQKNSVKIGQNNGDFKQNATGENCEQTTNAENGQQSVVREKVQKVSTGENSQQSTVREKGKQISTGENSQQNAVREKGLQVSCGENGLQNAKGTNGQLKTDMERCPQTVDAESSQQSEQSGEDYETDVLQKDELDARSSPLKADSDVGSYSTAEASTCYDEETIYACDECGLVMMRPLQLARHKKKHEREKNGAKELHGCSVCGQQFELTRRLRKHMLIDHGLVLPAKDVTNEKGQIIPNRLREKLHVCDICGLKLTRPSHLQKHILTHKDNETVDKTVDLHWCEVCGLEYRSQHTLRRHMLFHETEGKSIPDTKGEWLGKIECEENYEAGNQPKVGTNNDPKPVCDAQDAERNSNNGQNCRQNEEQNNQVKCGREQQDGEHFDGENGQNDEEHNEEIGIITPSVDELVNEITRREGTLAVCATEVKFEDLVAKMYICTICGLRRNSPSQLERHMKMHEMRKKGTYLCDQCGADYKCVGFLERHKLTHVVENSRVQSTKDTLATKDDFVNGIPLSEIVTMSEITQDTTTSVEQSRDNKPSAEKILIQYNTFYVCDECGTKFEHAKELLQHKLAHRREKIPRAFVCKECGMRCVRQCQLEQHMRATHLNLRPHLCNICGKGLRCKENLLQHIRTHTGEKPFACDACGKGFAVKNARDKHRLLHSGRKPHKCEVCAKGFITSGNLQQHMVTHTGERRYACTICDKRFTAGCVLKGHMRFHTGEKPFSCSVCFKAFRSKGNLQQHYVTHTKVKAFECEMCNKRFVAASTLKTHMRLHEGVKPHVCKICQKSFYALGNLKVHEALHSAERPFSCCECGKAFKLWAHVKGHLVVHKQPGLQHKCRVPEGDCAFLRFKNVLEAQSHDCTECGKKFNVPNKLRQHMVVHTREKVSLCTLCGMGFSCSGSLKTHMRIHNGVKPYSCDVCGKRFTQIGNRNKHLSLHTGERPFKCNVCPRTFRLHSGLTAHMLGHIGKAPVKKRKKGPSNALRIQKALKERKEQYEKQFVELEDDESVVEQSDYDSDESESSDNEDAEDSEDQEGSDDEDEPDRGEQE